MKQADNPRIWASFTVRRLMFKWHLKENKQTNMYVCMWWLILGVNLSGPWQPDSWLTLLWIFLWRFFWMRWSFKSVDFEESGLPSVMWKGRIQSVEGLNRNKVGPSQARRNSARLLLLDSSLGLQTAHLLCRLWAYQASTITWTNSLKSLSLSRLAVNNQRYPSLTCSVFWCWCPRCTFPIMADFKLPTCCGWPWSWREMCRTTPLHSVSTMQTTIHIDNLKRIDTSKM